MTLKYMQGFDTMRDDSDLRAQGWIAAPSKLTMALSPSISGVAGTSLHFMGPGSTNTGANGSSGTPDIGFFNTGITVNQAWQAGGCTFGFYGKFNSGVNASYGAAALDQVCFDGTLYWAIKLQSGAYNVATSPDLRNWTVTPAQPAGGANVNASLFYLGGGIVGVISGAATAASGCIVYYTSNNGSSWSTSASMLALGGTKTMIGIGFATGNATYPHGIAFGLDSVSSVASNFGGIFIGTISGTMTQVATFGTAAWYVTGRPYIANGLIIVNSQGTAQFGALAANASLNTAGAWTQSTYGAIGNKTMMAYSPTSNNWVVATTAGLYSFANSGAAGSPQIPSGTPTVTQRYSTTGMNAVYWTGSQFVAAGSQGHIATSPDGITWTEVGARILPVGVSGTNWASALYDGTQYVLFSDSTNGVIATTTDLVNNYTVQYVTDGAEQGAWVNGNGHTAICSGTAPAAGTGLWTPTSNYFGFALGPLSGGTRGVHVINTTSGTESTFNIGNAGTQLGHYYELVCRSAATTNNFTHEIWIDGAIAYSSGTSAFLLASSTSDTTSLLILCLDRFATFTAYDDMYFNLIDGQGLSGPLGIVNIVAQRPTTDVQAQFTRTGSAGSNALSVNQSALSSLSTNFVSSANTGDKDIYSTTDTLPSGFTPKAVMNEAYFTKASTTAPGVSVGSISGSTEADSPTVSISGTGATYVSQIQEKDQNGNVAWSSASVNALKFAINHVS